MTTIPCGSNMLQDYQSFAERVQKLLRNDTGWQDLYAGYAADLLAGKDQLARDRKAIGGLKELWPLYCYVSIDGVRKGYFDLRFLGQNVGRIKVKNGVPWLTVDKKTDQSSREYYGYKLGPIIRKRWDAEDAQAFRDHYLSLAEDLTKLPRQKEHMVESALFSELEKEKGDGKTLKFIQPFRGAPGVRLHMKTALSASGCSKSPQKDPTLANKGNGGDIDVFCRRRTSNRTRLTVIEVKDENKSEEPFHLVIRQAIAYAVFIRELARSKSGPDWKKLWGMENQPWETEGFTINAVAAMPKGETTDFPFAKMKLELKSEDPEGPSDWIELHYMAFLGEDQPRDGRDRGVRFETSL